MTTLGEALHRGPSNLQRAEPSDRRLAEKETCGISS